MEEIKDLKNLSAIFHQKRHDETVLANKPNQVTYGNVKRIVCLANSRRPGGRCIAGKELLPDGRPGGWVRPISARIDDGVSKEERQYADGSDPRVLDVIDVAVSKAKPERHQKENWLIRPGTAWKRTGRVAKNNLTPFVDMTAQLWIDGYSTTTDNGLNNKVPSSRLGSLNDSLRFIWVNDLELSIVGQSGMYPGTNKQVLQGHFRYGNTGYRLRVTDPVYETQYLRRLEDNENGQAV